MAKSFEDLNIWIEAKGLTLKVYQLMSHTNDFGFKDQLQRAAVSIMNNIAEGSEAGSNSLFVRYLNVAKGSCAEVRSMLILAKELNYITAENTDVLIEQSKYISRGISNFIKYLNTSKD